MKRGKLRTTGISFITLGLFLILTSHTGITGSAILWKFLQSSHSFVGFTFFALGLFFFVLSYEPQGSLENRARTKKMKPKDIRRLENAYFNPPTKSKELRALLANNGYGIQGGGKHLHILLKGKTIREKNGRPVIFPEGKKINPYTSKGIIEDLLGYKPKK